MCFFVQTNHTRKELLFLMFKEINLRNHSSLHKLFYSLNFINACYHGIIHFVKNITNKKGDFYLCQEMKDLVKLFLLVMVL